MFQFHFLSVFSESLGPPTIGIMRSSSWYTSHPHTRYYIFYFILSSLVRTSYTNLCQSKDIRSESSGLIVVRRSLKGSNTKPCQASASPLRVRTPKSYIPRLYSLSLSLSYLILRDTCNFYIFHLNRLIFNSS